VSIAVALGLTTVVAQAFPLSFFVTNMIVGMGLALGIDYTLFVLTRYREERGRGRTVSDAIAAAGGTAGRAVLFSGMAVVLALVGMLFVPDTVLRSLGVGAILVGVVSVVAALTVLPAVLGVLGDRVNAGALPGRRARPKAPAGTSFWARVADIVMRRPVVSLVLSVVFLVVCAIPVVDLRTGTSGVTTLPDRVPSKQGFVVLDREFDAGRGSPAEIVIDGRVDSPPIRRAIDRLRARIDRDGDFGQSSAPQVNRRRDLALVTAPIAGDVAGPRAFAAIRRLRSDYIPDAFGAAPAQVFVTGATASAVDEDDATSNAAPYMFAFVLGLSFVLLTLAFRSIVVPVKAIVMNLLSVGAAYGLLVLVFQQGHGASLFGFAQVEAVESWVPLFLFSILFGLSMDYHVFLLSRIRERFNQTGDNREAVATGITTTSRLITGAALIMVAVFSGFAAGDLVMFQQMGFGLAVALLIDATIVRSVLVPATMTLLGKRNWYLPRWLRWLPEVGVEGQGR
jgi:RND superfamily putative drug exporter